MKVPFFLTVGANKSVRVTKTKPRLEWDEISVFVTLNLPDGLFKKPSLTAEITIPDSAANPSEIAADVQDNVREAIEMATGMEVKITFGAEKD